MSNYGKFLEDGRQYAIYDYNTPRPQMNYMWNDKFLSGVNHFGGGIGSYGNRCASYIDSLGRGRAILIRNGARYFYVKDENTGKVFNPGWYPLKTELDEYQCTHALGSTKVYGKKDGVEVTADVFVGERYPAELWSVKLKNTSSTIKKLNLYSYAEFSLEGYSRYSEYDSYVYSEYISEENMVFAVNTAQERPHDFYSGYAATDVMPNSYETSANAFLGRYGSVENPNGIHKKSLTNSKAACEIMCAAFQHCMELLPGEERVIRYIYGSADTTEYAKKAVGELFSEGAFENERKRMEEKKRSLWQNGEIETPDEKVKAIINYWLKNQIQLCCEAGRATGKGFRDQLQDAWGICAFDQATAKEKIKETLHHQYSDGRCVRGWLPLDNHIYSDGPVWIAPTVNAYLKETGDYSFLDETVDYLDSKKATVWEHILISAEHLCSDTGEHGLVLARDGDWNDSLNGIGIKGKGESVWTTIAACYALSNTAEIALHVKKDMQIHNDMLKRYADLKEAVNKNAWDGEWYLAAYNDDGQKVGTKTEKEGFIYLNSQTWAILAGVCDDERAEKITASVKKYLDSDYGPLTLYPAYRKYNPSIGRLTGFVPGIWENSTPYCHGGMFKVVSDCIRCDADEAYETLKKIMPDAPNNPSDYSGCEPYVFTNMYFGPENPRKGQSSFAWVTGTAGWAYRAVTQYMLGFYPGYGGFLLKPCMPKEWKKCSYTRKYRGDIYDITVYNSGKKDAERIVVDGKQTDEKGYIKYFNDKGKHTIEIYV